MGITKELLSASTDGLGVTVVATATLGTIIHTADAAAKDEIWLWAYNSHTAPVVLSVEWGGATLPRKITIPADDGLYVVIPGLVLTNSKIARAFAATASVIVIDGYVNRIT